MCVCVCVYARVCLRVKGFILYLIYYNDFKIIFNFRFKTPFTQLGRSQSQININVKKKFDEDGILNDNIKYSNNTITTTNTSIYNSQINVSVPTNDQLIIKRKCDDISNSDIINYPNNKTNTSICNSQLDFSIPRNEKLQINKNVKRKLDDDDITNNDNINYPNNTSIFNSQLDFSIPRNEQLQINKNMKRKLDDISNSDNTNYHNNITNKSIFNSQIDFSIPTNEKINESFKVSKNIEKSNSKKIKINFEPHTNTNLDVKLSEYPNENIPASGNSTPCNNTLISKENITLLSQYSSQNIFQTPKKYGY